MLGGNLNNRNTNSSINTKNNTNTNDNQNEDSHQFVHGVGGGMLKSSKQPGRDLRSLKELF